MRDLWLSLVSWLHLPRGIHRRQLVLAVLSFALPLALIPLTYVSTAPVSAVRLLWQSVPSYPGSKVVRRVFVGRLGTDAALYVVGDTSGLAVSQDAGASWSWANTGFPKSQLHAIRLVDVAVDPLAPGVMFAAVDSSAATPRPMLYWTVDGGLHWQPRANLGRERVRALAFGAGSEELYVATANDVRRATVSHEPGTPVATPQERFARDRDDLQYEIVASFVRATQATLLMVGAAHGLDAPGAQTLFVGTDAGGLTLMSGAGVAEVRAADADTRYLRQQATLYALCVQALTPPRLYAGTERGLYVSENAGQSWHRTGAALGDRRVLCLYVPPTAPDTLLAGVAGGGVYFSQDGGVNWEPLGHGLAHSSVYSLALDEGASPPVLFAATSAGLWRLPLVSN